MKQPPHPKPSSLKKHTYTKRITANADPSAVWKWLNTMETFTKGQLPPYKVEFVNPTSKGKPTFDTGVYTNHHGPLLSACGTIGEMIENKYRDLNYTYGSYVISFRLIRPTRLQFWLEETGDKTDIKMTMDSYVHPRFESIWNLGLKMFGATFKSWVGRTFRG